jgi:hypothetical protein
MSDKPKFAPKCVWCNAEWSDANIKVYDFDATDECESGRFGPEEVSVAIVCHACNREMYRKEGAKNCYSGPYSWKSGD